MIVEIIKLKHVQSTTRVANRPVFARTSWFSLPASCVLCKVLPGRQTSCFCKWLTMFPSMFICWPKLCNLFRAWQIKEPIAQNYLLQHFCHCLNIVCLVLVYRFSTIFSLLRCLMRKRFCKSTQPEH